MIFTIPNSKSLNPCTFRQLQYLESFSNVSIETTSSQILAKVSKAQMSDLIDAAKEGEHITIKR